jgi:hypothetical protein
MFKHASATTHETDQPTGLGVGDRVRPLASRMN